MSKHFLDSNVCIYAFDKADTTKCNTAIELICASPCISSQVIIETYNACSRKLKLPQDVCDENTLFLNDITTILPINDEVINMSIFLKRKYNFSFLDSCIVASALCGGCTVLYTEDMQHNLLVENLLRVVNPFL